MPGVDARAYSSSVGGPRNNDSREEISISRQTHHLRKVTMTFRMTKACQAFTAVIVKANPTVMIVRSPKRKTKILSNS